jgi:hypothetical protein
MSAGGLRRRACCRLCPSPLQDELPENLANASSTIAWWQSRQAEMQARLDERRAALNRAAKTVSESLGAPGNGSAAAGSNGNGNSNGRKAAAKRRIFDLVGGKASK